MKRFLVLMIFLTLAAGCGESRDSEFAAGEEDTTSSTADDAAGTDAEPDQTDEADPASTTTVPPVPDTTGVPTETAMSATFGSSEWEITHGELNEIVGPTIDDDEFSAIVFGGQPAPGFAANVLTQLFVSEVLRVELETTGVEVAPADLDESKKVLIADLQTLLPEDPDAQKTVESFFDDEPYLQFLMEFQARQEALSTTLAADGEPTEQSLPCARHILVETVEEADEILAELEDGGDFAAIAIERSLDTGSGAQGGDLGCADPVNYVPEFKAAIEGAEIGETVGPVETEFGAHIIVVDRIETSEVEVDGRLLATEILQERLELAEITVDPAIGVWDTEQLAITPAQ